MPQYLTLGVDRDVFAIPVVKVQEILDLRPISSLPYAPAEIAGLIDVRGRSVTVIDLRAKLGMSAAAATDATRIIILDANNNGTGAFGLIADRVHEVTDLDTESLEAAPELGKRWDFSLYRSHRPLA